MPQMVRHISQPPRDHPLDNRVMHNLRIGTGTAGHTRADARNTAFEEVLLASACGKQCVGHPDPLMVGRGCWVSVWAVTVQVDREPWG